MFQQTNPFLQHAVNHAQSLLTAVNRTSSLSQDIVFNCDNIIASINSGNTQNAINSLQTIRTMAGQVSQSAQLINQAVNERLDMTAYVLGALQHKITEMSNVVQSLKNTSANNQMQWNQAGMYQQNQYGAPQQQTMAHQYGNFSVPQQ